jgi:type I restriction enzyme R subunit
MFWLARTYARDAKPADGLSFNPDLLPKSSSVSPQTLEQLQNLESELRERDETLSQLLSGKKVLDEELQRLRIEVAEAKQRNAAQPDGHSHVPPAEPEA